MAQEVRHRHLRLTIMRCALKRRNGVLCVTSLLDLTLNPCTCSWFEEDVPAFTGQRSAVADADKSCGLSESDVFSLGLTSLPAARQPGGYVELRQQQQQAQPWSAFASSAGLEGCPPGDVQGLGIRAAEPSLLEEALTSCGLQSLCPQLSGSSLDATNTAAGRCSSLGPSGSIKQGDFLRLPSSSALVRAFLADICKGSCCSRMQAEHVAAETVCGR